LLELKGNHAQFCQSIFFSRWLAGRGASSIPTAAKPADKAGPPQPNLPSEATVDSFMQQTFGYEPQVTWKISSIKPAPVPGLAQVDVVPGQPAGPATQPLST
jgi:hypothetical protein